MEAANIVITFNVQYKTNFGENMFVVGEGPQLGNWDATKGLPLKWTENHIWTASHTFTKDTKEIIYKYIVNNSDNNVRWESSKNREVKLPNEDNINIIDDWEQTNWKIELEIKGKTPAKPAPRREAPLLTGDSLTKIRDEIVNQAELIRKMRGNETIEGSLSAHAGKDKILEQVTKLLELKYLDPVNWPRDKVIEDAKVPVIKARWKIVEPSGKIIRLQVPFIGVTHIDAIYLAQFIQTTTQRRYPSIGDLKLLFIQESKTKRIPVVPGDQIILPLIFPGPLFKSLYSLKLITEWTGKPNTTKKSYWGYRNY